MVTGASTADLAIVLVDARHGVVEQSRRHAFIASLLRIPHLVVAREQDGPGRLRPGGVRARAEPSSAILRRELEVPDLTFIPISALHGDNVVHRSREHAVVRGAVAAAPPRRRSHGERPQPDRRAFSGAVRDPPAVRRMARLPGLCGAGRGRRVQAGRRGDGAAVRVHHRASSRIDTLRRAGRRGVSRRCR